MIYNIVVHCTWIPWKRRAALVDKEKRRKKQEKTKKKKFLDSMEKAGGTSRRKLGTRNGVGEVA